MKRDLRACANSKDSDQPVDTIFVEHHPGKSYDMKAATKNKA